MYKSTTFHSDQNPPPPIYIYEGEQECFSDGSCTLQLYWAYSETTSEIEQLTEITNDDPCQKIPVLKNDNEFKQKMVDLKNATNGSIEVAYTIYDDPTPNTIPGLLDNYDYTRFEGAPNVPAVNWSGNTNMKGLIHSHFFQGLSVPSPGDLQDLYKIMSNNQVTDDFFSGLVTDEGTAYILQVNDRAAFLEFGNKYLSTLEKIADFSNNIYSDPEEYNIDTDIIPSANEKSFVKMLTELNAGISVYKPTDLTFTDYKKLNYFNNQVTESNCD